MIGNDKQTSKRSYKSFEDANIRIHGEKVIDKWNEFGEMSAIEDDVFLFVIEANGAIEQHSSRIICDYVISDEYSDDAFEYVYSQMSQTHRERLLSQCGILNDLWGNLNKFRHLRNKIAHDRGEGIDWYGDNIEECINDAMDAVVTLWSFPTTGGDGGEENA